MCHSVTSHGHKQGRWIPSTSKLSTPSTHQTGPRNILIRMAQIFFRMVGAAILTPKSGCQQLISKPGMGENEKKRPTELEAYAKVMDRKWSVTSSESRASYCRFVTRRCTDRPPTQCPNSCRSPSDPCGRRIKIISVVSTPGEHRF